MALLSSGLGTALVNMDKGRTDRIGAVEIELANLHASAITGIVRGVCLATTAGYCAPWIWRRCGRSGGRLRV
jgi:hypothetical protein